MSEKPPLPALPPSTVKARLAEGAVLIDVRERHEHNAEHIPGDMAVPLSALPERIDTQGRLAIFYCNSSRRTWQNAGRLAAAAGGEAFQLEGGLIAWKAAGLPVAGGDAAALAGANLLSQMLAAYAKKDSGE